MKRLMVVALLLLAAPALALPPAYIPFRTILLQPVNTRIGVTQITSPWVVSSTQLPAALDGSGFLKVHEQGTATISGTVTANQGGTWTVQPGNTANTTAWLMNVGQFGGTNVSTGTGAGGAGIPRVTISNDSSLAANQSVNLNQVAGAGVATGNGVAAGSIRVTVANDSTGILATVTNVATIGTSVTPGTSAAHLGKAEDAVAGSADTGVFILGVRRDTPTTSQTSASGDYGEIATDQFGAVWTRERQIATYSAGTTAKTATAAGTGPFFTICGSASKTLRVQRFNASYTVGTAAIYGDVVLKKTSTATSAGTATALTKAPHDSNSAASTANAVNYYTVLATAGTSVGVVYAFPQLNSAVTGTVNSTLIPSADANWFARTESEAIVLRGTAQCLEANFGTTTTNAPTFTISVTWTEE